MFFSAKRRQLRASLVARVCYCKSLIFLPLNLPSITSAPGLKMLTFLFFKAPDRPSSYYRLQAPLPWLCKLHTFSLSAKSGSMLQTKCTCDFYVHCSNLASQGIQSIPEGIFNGIPAGLISLWVNAMLKLLVALCYVQTHRNLLGLCSGPYSWLLLLYAGI